MGKEINHDMTIHTLKIMTEYFDALVHYGKSFEVRKNDRNFKVGDLLRLREWDDHAHDYTGAEIQVRVTYILHGGQFGIEEGFCVMSIQFI